MRLQIEYSLRAPGWMIGQGHESLRYDLAGRVFDVRSAGSNGEWNVLVDGPVDPKSIRVATEDLPTLEDGTSVRMLDVPEAAALTSFAHDLTDVLSFLYSRQMTLYSAMKRRLVPENDEDRRLLGEMGTSEPYSTIRLTNESLVQAADTPPPASTVEALLSRSSGLKLYVREQPELEFVRLWRVLESAFGVQGRKLSEKIASFPPAVALGFDQSELENLRATRGQAAHAAARRPHIEANEARWMGLKSTERLRLLVRTVLLTKKTWGTPTAFVHAVEIPSAAVGRPPR